jgi:hypothetical protein
MMFTDGLDPKELEWVRKVGPSENNTRAPVSDKVVSMPIHAVLPACRMFVKMACQELVHATYVIFQHGIL